MSFADSVGTRCEQTPLLGVRTPAETPGAGAHTGPETNSSFWNRVKDNKIKATSAAVGFAIFGGTSFYSVLQMFVAKLGAEVGTPVGIIAGLILGAGSGLMNGQQMTTLFDEKPLVVPKHLQGRIEENIDNPDQRKAYYEALQICFPNPADLEGYWATIRDVPDLHDEVTKRIQEAAEKNTPWQRALAILWRVVKMAVASPFALYLGAPWLGASLYHFYF